MFDFDIALSKKSDSQKVILKLPISFYIIFSVIAAIIFTGIIMYGASVFSIIIFFISVVSLTYKEAWTFDKNSRKVTAKNGVGFVYKTIDFNFDDIELIELVSFIKGRNNAVEKSEKLSILRKKYYSIKLHINNGKDFTLITVTENKKVIIDLMLNEIENITNKKVER
jgi:hypothetical protein